MAQKGTIMHVETNLYGLVDELIDEVPFKTVKWSTGRNLPRKIYRIDSKQELLRYPTLTKVTETIEEMLGRHVNGLWLNHYTDGSDWCPYHKDSYGCDVASFSAGATRDFATKEDYNSAVAKYPLSDGDILFFDSTFNEHNKHAVPVRKRVVDPRVSVVAFLE